MLSVAPFFCLLFVYAIFATLTGVVAYHKGRNVVGWTLLGLLGWIPLLIVACLPNLKDQQARESYQSEENRRLREQLRQERIKSESFRQHAASRLDAHDKQLGIDTRASGPLLAAGQSAGALGSGDSLDPPESSMPRWYYGRQGQTYGPIAASQVSEFIRTQIITRETLLWSEDMTDWTPAADVAHFATQFM
jgi:hypothetical protein